ncbi:MAG: hypothetical protein KY476_01800 [Planctomycetes bacterium]|nr:hypothetical protein [Planctomycetota bacterium]
MSVRLSAGLVCASAPILAVGCYSYHPYTPGYHGGYPTYTSPPVITSPGGAYLPGTVTPSPGIDSGSQFQAPTRGGTPTYPDAPLYDDGSGTGNGGNGGNYVPNYRDLDDRSGSGSGTSFGPEGQTPFGLKEDDETGGAVLTASAEGEATTVVQADANDVADPPLAKGGPGGVEDAAALPDPYAHDPEYRWLRGVVDYDRTNETWNIIYDLEPAASDRWGGTLTLVDDPLLARLRDGDVVLIEGRVDASTRDRTGRKPRYRIEHLVAPLVADPSRTVARREE